MDLAKISEVPVRLLLLQGDLVSTLRLRLAIDLSAAWSAVRVVDKTVDALRSLCDAIRGGLPPPQVILSELGEAGRAGADVLGLLPGMPELAPAALVVVGDRASSRDRSRAASLGARALIDRPQRPDDVVRAGRDITQACRGLPASGS